MGDCLGWIGLGRMGEAMVKRLLKGGHGVMVWNRTRSKADPLVEYGADVAANRHELATCDLVFTVVSTTDDLKEVLWRASSAFSPRCTRAAGRRERPRAGTCSRPRACSVRTSRSCTAMR